jgi:7-cyano-7-deazaguanine synthase
MNSLEETSGIEPGPLPHANGKGGTACILLSGGLDSTACLDFALRRGFAVSALFIDYGQAARVQERRSAALVAERFGVGLRELKVEGCRGQGAGLVLGRNAFLLFLALMESSGECSSIGTGVHAGTRYYDCSRSFIESAQRMFDGYADGRVRISAPFLDWSKLDIWAYCQAHSVPTALTYSCEIGGETPCGRCLSCRDREALHAG